MDDIENCEWLTIWTTLARSYAYTYNPALQPRALIAYGCICKCVSDLEIKLVLRTLVDALDTYNDIVLVEALIRCLTRLLPELQPDSNVHPVLFWVAIAVLQFDEESLYAAGLALLEQNLHTLDKYNYFEKTVSYW